jgi:hypothetical protein
MTIKVWKVVAILLLALIIVGCGGPPREFDTYEERILSSSRARKYCLSEGYPEYVTFRDVFFCLRKVGCGEDDVLKVEMPESWLSEE